MFHRHDAKQKTGRFGPVLAKNETFVRCLGFVSRELLVDPHLVEAGEQRHAVVRRDRDFAWMSGCA